MNIIDYLSSSIVFWLAWVIIPFIMEIIPSIFNFLYLLKKKFLIRKRKELTFFPPVTIIIPVYNSADTLEECLESINKLDYPRSQIYVMLVHNQGQDNSIEIFWECQKKFPELAMNWLDAKQGKSKALNLALFNSKGKYIINVDSDGMFEKSAIKNIVQKFENEPDTHCVTGVILINEDMIEDSKKFRTRIFRRAEYFEYAQAFLAGRNFQSEFNTVYTLSGAFSAFRRSTILKTQMYNTDTVGEDTHVTFQIRETLKLKVKLCENAFFKVDPIENLNKLYTQRQRWQRGEMEVNHMFRKSHQMKIQGFFSDFVTRLTMYDHTFAFPRMIWYFALLFLVFINYPIKLVIISLVLIYLLYVFSSFLYYLNICIFLWDFKKMRRYFGKKIYMVVIMPGYSFMVFWIRFAGIINSISSAQTWKTKNLKQEKESFSSVITHDFRFLIKFIKKIKKKVNIENGDRK